MTATLRPVPPVDAESVSTTLFLAHDEWMERITRILAPATFPRASFWERWGTVRFLADEFEGRFRVECELIDGIDEVSPSHRARLAAVRRAVESTRAELMAAGRRRGTGQEVALLTRRFLDQARHWCAMLELATMTIATADLTGASRARLERIRAGESLEL
jgi:hypothetical protein